MSKLLAIQLLKKDVANNPARRIHVRFRENAKRGGIRVSPQEALLYLNAGVARAKVSPEKDRVVDLRLNMALPKVASIITQLYRSGKSGLVAEDCKTHQREGRGFIHNRAHCEAYVNVTHKADFERVRAKYTGQELE